MLIYGGMQQGGNLGQVAVGNPLLDPRFKIQGGEPWNKTPILPGKETKDFENQPIPRPMLPGGQGNLLAQGIPPAGNAGALGGPMMMQSPYGNKPLNIDINAVDQGIESVGGSANIQLDDNQLLRLGGSFNPAGTNQMGMQSPQGFSIYGNYETPGFGLNVNYRNTGGRQQAPGGFPGEIQAGFGTRFR
jgi:hypothetical protein